MDEGELQKQGYNISFIVVATSQSKLQYILKAKLTSPPKGKVFSVVGKATPSWTTEETNGTLS